MTGPRDDGAAATETRSPIATCREATCAGCPAGESVQCHFTVQSHLLLSLAAAPSLLIGAAGLFTLGLAPLLGWAAYMALFFGLIEIRVLCSHCPHYAERGRFLRCWANRGGLKLWAYRPGPLTRAERWIFLAGLAIVWLLPLGLLVGARLWLLSVLLAVTTAGFFTALKLGWCSRCMNLACPLNGVDSSARDMWITRNPGASPPQRPM